MNSRLQQEAIRDMRGPFQKRNVHASQSAVEVSPSTQHRDRLFSLLTTEAKIARAAVESCDVGLGVRGIIPSSDWYKLGMASLREEAVTGWSAYRSYAP